MKDDRNIVLTGFMGTGKTTVGQCVAEKTQRLLVDTDEEIARQAGKPISTIFQEDGESYFRYLERRVCRFYAGQRGYVIATGGGMLVDEVNRQVMDAAGLVVCLDATPDAIRERLAEQTGRPLFGSDWEELYERRRSAYAAIKHHIDTTDKTPEAVAQEVITLWQTSST
ncbi:MAG: shikimate kinase [Anaerolineae bacterium]|nr:shikimate kinase [Anaerolineae bacterium]